jgi:hypothetical protein
VTIVLREETSPGSAAAILVFSATDPIFFPTILVVTATVLVFFVTDPN